jgi:hypothetical protein
MRTLTALSIVTLMLAGCYVGIGLNDDGPAIDEAGTISKISILPAVLPSRIDGALTDADEKNLRSELPSDAADWLAAGITDETDSVVWASTASEKPTTGYYMTFQFIGLNVGDEEAAAADADNGHSTTSAKASIYNAASGELVAELTINKSSGWLGEPPVQQDIKAMARDIGKWFESKR